MQQSHKASSTRLDRLRDMLRVPMRFVHVLRNPYDNISTISRQHEVPLETAIDGYFSMVRSVAQVREKVGADAVFDLHSEAFIARPQPLLRALCEFLGQDADEAYLADCASIVFPAPRRTRAEAGWTPALLADVRARIADVPLLQHYEY